MLVVNPTMKMDWIQKYWTAEEAANAEEWVLESVSLHQLNLWPGVLTRKFTDTRVSSCRLL
jgi:hypothetical protein